MSILRNLEVLCACWSLETPGCVEPRWSVDMTSAVVAEAAEAIGSTGWGGGRLTHPLHETHFQPESLYTQKFHQLEIDEKK